MAPKWYDNLPDVGWWAVHSASGVSPYHVPARQVTCQVRCAPEQPIVAFGPSRCHQPSPVGGTRSAHPTAAVTPSTRPMRMLENISDDRYVIYIYIFIYIYNYIYIYIYMYACMYVCVWVCMWVCMLACIYVCMACKYVCKYVYLYAFKNTTFYVVFLNAYAFAENVRML